MSYKVFIQNNETKKVEVCEENVVAILGAITRKDNCTTGIGMVSCNALQLLGTLRAAKNAIKNCEKSHPELALVDMLGICKTVEVKDKKTDEKKEEKKNVEKDLSDLEKQFDKQLDKLLELLEKLAPEKKED